MLPIKPESTTKIAAANKKQNKHDATRSHKEKFARNTGENTALLRQAARNA
jgi:hypothetical protein